MYNPQMETYSAHKDDGAGNGNPVVELGIRFGIMERYTPAKVKGPVLPPREFTYAEQERNLENFLNTPTLECNHT
jgi:hypothetical protein